MSILGTLAELNQDATVVMHEVDATAFGGDVYRFHDGLGHGVDELVWCGKKYTFWPVEIEDLRIEGDKPTRPRLRLGNPGGYVTKLCEDYQDLLGAVYTLRTTKGRFLDSANFAGWEGYAVAMEGWTKFTGSASGPITSVLLEVKSPKTPEAGKTARVILLEGGQSLSVSIRDGRLFVGVGSEARDVGAATPEQKLTVALHIADASGKLRVTGHVNEVAFTWQTAQTYGEPQQITIGGADNQTFHIRTLVLRRGEFTVQDTRAYKDTGVVSQPTAHYRFSAGTTTDEITSVPLTLVNTAKSIQESYYYSLYGMSKMALERFDALGSVYLVDWVKANPNASIYEEMPAEKFRVVRKAAESPMEVVFELAPLYDVKGVKLPLKIVTENVCLHTYRDEFCGYRGPAMSIDGLELDVPGAHDGATAEQIAAIKLLDVCSHDKKGCMARFGRVLPIGSFLGAGRVRR